MHELFDQEDDVRLLVDADTGLITEANDSACRYFGKSKEDMLGADVRELGLSHRWMNLDNNSAAEHKRDTSKIALELATIPVEHGGKKLLFFILCDTTKHKHDPQSLMQAAQQVRSIFECASVGIYQISPEGRFIYANPATARLFGYETPTDLFREVRDISTQLYPDPDRRKPVLERLNKHNQVQGFELELKHRDGRLIWISFDGRTVRDEWGRVLYYEGFMSDITERKHAESALQKSLAREEQYRQKLEAIFRSIPDAIITVDKDMRVLAVNEAVMDICDLHVEPGASFLEIADRPNCPCRKALKDILENNKAVGRRKFACPQRGSSNRVIEMNCSPLLDKDGRFSGAVLVLKDITRLTDLEIKLEERHSFGNIIGKSKPMQDIFRLLEQLSDVDSTVLVRGESGTGKELIIDALHYGGSRREGPLVKVNCGALPDNLLESELFGHVRGAFTGAVKDKVGRFQAAEGGTIFLDEIGDVSPFLQTKLLRVLEQKEYERLGESKTRKANVRVLAATNADLLKLVEKGLFRDDLYYRLNVMCINLPPLRDRLEDIPLLMDSFIREFSAAFKKRILGVTPEVMEYIMRYPWPGNIRELKHAMEHACILCQGDAVELEHLPADMTRQAQDSPLEAKTGRKAKGMPGPEDILDALDRTEGNKAKAARMLGIGRVTLYRKIKEFGL